MSDVDLQPPPAHLTSGVFGRFCFRLSSQTTLQYIVRREGLPPLVGRSLSVIEFVPERPQRRVELLLARIAARIMHEFALAGSSIALRDEGEQSDE